MRPAARRYASLCVVAGGQLSLALQYQQWRAQPPASHTAAARAKGATDAQINELYAVVALANMTNRLANAYKVPVDEAFKPKE